MGPFTGQLGTPSRMSVPRWVAVTQEMLSSPLDTDYLLNVCGVTSLACKDFHCQFLVLLLCTDVLHTVGPINWSDSKLRSCYERCLQLTLENGIRSVVSHKHHTFLKGASQVVRPNHFDLVKEVTVVCQH